MDYKKYIFLLASVFLFTGCSYQTSLMPMEIQRSQKNVQIIWGINGHPIVDKEYVESSLKQQLDLLKEHQFSIYRVDVNLSKEGFVKGNREERFDSLIQMANTMDIQIFPVLKFYNEFIDGKILSDEEAYSLGKGQGENFAKKYANTIQYYGIENELDLKTIQPNTKGMSPQDYDSEKIRNTIPYLKGMIEGIKSIDHDAETIINYGGWYNWGFIQLLLDSGVSFDILGCHWYSENGRRLFRVDNPALNVLDVVREFSIPIWITEISKYNGSKHHTEVEQAEMMKLFLEDLKNRPEVSGFFIYELYDQPHLATQKWVNYEAAYYGIVGWKNDPPIYSEYYYKPISDMLKFRIEEEKYGVEDYIVALFEDLKNEVPTKQKLNYWTNKFNNEIISDFITNFLTEETISHSTLKGEFSKTDKIGMQNYLKGIFETYLRRYPSTRELKYWERKIKKKDIPSIEFDILTSKEYWEKAVWNGYHLKLK